MDNFYSEYLERIRDSLQQQSALGRLSRFITLHTYLGGKGIVLRDMNTKRP